MAFSWICLKQANRSPDRFSTFPHLLCISTRSVTDAVVVGRGRGGVVKVSVANRAHVQEVGH